MNWKLILQLSVFGLIMAFGTISLIPQKTEPLFWLIIFGFCAFVIAKACENKYFLHGFTVSMINCIWITIIHLIFRHTYFTTHPSIHGLNDSISSATSVHPRVVMMIVGIVSGVLSGVILGLFSYVASKLVKKQGILN